MALTNLVPSRRECISLISPIVCIILVYASIVGIVYGSVMQHSTCVAGPNAMCRFAPTCEEFKYCSITAFVPDSNRTLSRCVAKFSCANETRACYVLSNGCPSIDCINDGAILIIVSSCVVCVVCAMCAIVLLNRIFAKRRQSDESIQYATDI